MCPVEGQTVPHLPAAEQVICERLPWLPPDSPPLPPDPEDGDPACMEDLVTELRRLTRKLGCDHDAIFADAYLTITRALKDATTTPGVFERPDRINHQARSYGQEYFDQFDRWRSGDRASVSPSWQTAFQAADHETVTAMGDLLLQLNAHIRRDNPIRAVEQSEGVLA